VEWETKGGRSAVEDAKEGNLGEVCGLACLRGKVGSHEDGAVEQMNLDVGTILCEVLREVLTHGLRRTGSMETFSSN
jgi:hypothetical protein